MVAANAHTVTATNASGRSTGKGTAWLPELSDVAKNVPFIRVELRARRCVKDTGEFRVLREMDQNSELDFAKVGLESFGALAKHTQLPNELAGCRNYHTQGLVLAYKAAYQMCIRESDSKSK
jgi:hypothetical protein